MWDVIAGFTIELLGLVLSVLAVYVIRWVRARITTEQQSLLESIIREVVLYVQQTHGAEPPDAKLHEAVMTALDWLADRRIKLEVDLVEVMIEAQVKKLKAEMGEAWNG